MEVPLYQSLDRGLGNLREIFFFNTRITVLEFWVKMADLHIQTLLSLPKNLTITVKDFSRAKPQKNGGHG